MKQIMNYAVFTWIFTAILMCISLLPIAKADEEIAPESDPAGIVTPVSSEESSGDGDDQPAEDVLGQSESEGLEMLEADLFEAEGSDFTGLVGDARGTLGDLLGTIDDAEAVYAEFADVIGEAEGILAGLPAESETAVALRTAIDDAATALLVFRGAIDAAIAAAADFDVAIDSAEQSENDLEILDITAGIESAIGSLNGAIDSAYAAMDDLRGVIDEAIKGGTPGTVYIPDEPSNTPKCDGKPATIIGTAGDDIIYGTDGDDVILALEGNDKVFGKAGNDTICGGPGHDSLRGGSGEDILLGGEGNDGIAGGDEWDYVDGNGGVDHCTDDIDERLNCEGHESDKGLIVIVKDAQPDDPQDFSFSGDLGEFTLDDNFTDTRLDNTFIYEAGSQYELLAVTEAEQEGWQLDGIHCTDLEGDTFVDTENRTAYVDLVPRQVTTCVFVNTPVKTPVPGNDDDDDVIDDGRPVVRMLGIRHLPENIYDTSVEIEACGTVNTTGYVAFEWELVSGAEPVTYFYELFQDFDENGEFVDGGMNSEKVFEYEEGTATSHYGGLAKASYEVRITPTDTNGIEGDYAACRVTYDPEHVPPAPGDDDDDDTTDTPPTDSDDDDDDTTDDPVPGDDDDDDGQDDPQDPGSGDDDDDDGTDTPPAVVATAGAGGGGSAFCPNPPVLSQISPIKNGVYRSLDEISFRVSGNIDPGKVAIRIDGKSVGEILVDLEGSSAFVTADISGFELAEETIIELFVPAKRPLCWKQAIYLVTIDPNASRTDEGKTSDESDFEVSPEGILFSDEQDALRILLERELITEREAEQDIPLTRSQVSRILFVILGIDIAEITVTENPFPDVPEGRWYSPYIEALKNRNILHGYGNGVFLPKREISRAETYKVLYLASGKTVQVTEEPIDCIDIEETAWYLPYLRSAQADEILLREGNGLCLPNRPILPSEFVRLLAWFFPL